MPSNVVSTDVVEIKVVDELPSSGERVDGDMYLVIESLEEPEIPAHPGDVLNDWTVEARAEEVEGQAGAPVSDTDEVHRIVDLSGNGHHFDTSSSFKPTWYESVASLNDRAACEFDNSQMDAAAWTTLSMPVSIVMVAQATSDPDGDIWIATGNDRYSMYASAPGHWRMETDLDSNSRINHFEQWDMNPHIFVMTFDGGSDDGIFRVDGLEAVAGMNDTHQMAQFVLTHSSATGRMSGYIGFVGAVNRRLTSQEIEDIEAAASSYYGIELPE